MSKTSCVQHPSAQQLVIIREDYVALCERAFDPPCPDPECGAALLNLFEFWTNIKLAHAEQSRKQNEIRIAQGLEPNQDESLWIWKTTEHFKTEMMGLWGENKIKDCRKWLVSAELIQQRNNPEHDWDRTYQYLFNLDLVNKLLPLVNSEHMQPLKINDQSVKNNPAIPETTTETTETPPPTPARGNVGAGSETDNSANQQTENEDADAIGVPDINTCFACGMQVSGGLNGMHEHLSTAHVITGGKRPIQDTIVTAPIVPVGQEGQVAFSVGEIFPAYICPDCHARYVQITDSSGGFPACKCTTQGDLYQAGLGNAYGALQAYYGLADTVGDPEAVAASVKLVSADTSWDALTNPPAHSIDRDGQPKPGRAAELRERFIASLRAECPQCHKQIAIAEVIDKGGARHRVCPDCHYEFPPAIQRHIVNDNGRLVTASLPALDEQQAAVVRNALDHQRGQVTDTQTITGWSEAIRLLVEAGYMESTNKRVGAFMLTEKGKELSEHPGVRKLRAQAQATREREEERKAARAEAKAKRPPKPKAKKEAPTSLQPELQDIADEFTRLRYHVPRFAELQEGARWGVMYFAETWIDHEYTIDDLRVVQKYFESKDWLTCRPSTYVEQLQDARNWKTGRGSANDNQLRIAADTPEIISRPLDAGEVE